MPTKICVKCNERKSLDRFKHDSRGYILSKCKDCHNEAARAKPRKQRAKVKQVRYAETKPEGTLQSPYVIPLAERPVYVPPKWGR